MPRSWHLNAKRTFSEAFDATVAETEAALRLRRSEMNDAWDALHCCFQSLEDRMVKVGITKPSGSEEEGMLRFNVGGALVNIRRSALEGRGHLGNLFESAWDKRLPRDSGGFVVLDHSPKCAKHILHAILNSSNNAASGTAKKLALGDGLPRDEEAYLPYVVSALGLAEHFVPISAVLHPNDFGPMSVKILSWCPDKPSGLELIYRASRDGWTPEAFYERCGSDSPSTVTLYRVSNNGRGTGDSVVGGFSSVPWTPATRSRSSFLASPKAFVFMLKDGTSSFQPVKWRIRRECRGRELCCDSNAGPSFGDDLEMDRCSSKPGLLMISNGAYKIPKDSPFVRLHGHDVVEMETFRVCPAETTPSPPSPPKPGLMDIRSFEDSVPSTEAGNEDDIRSFGAFVADSLMEETMALYQGHTELAEANAKAAASVGALAAVYGPRVAAGEEDTVVELNIRGTRMTTLRSTLQACPDSALAARFDKEKWPATEKDVDQRGRRLVDCRPSVFSKVLDVLRMRKQAALAGGVGCGEDGARVAVRAADRAAFEEFVGMYFPGCESFILDLVADLPPETRAIP